MVEPIARHQGQRLAGAGYLHIGDVPLRRLFTHHAHRALFPCHGNKPVAVHRLTADGDKYVALCRGAGVIAHAGDLLRHVGAGGQNVQSLQYVFQLHRIVSFAFHFRRLCRFMTYHSRHEGRGK